MHGHSFNEDVHTALSGYGGITDYIANQFDVHERAIHFMERHPISAFNQVAVESAHIVKALTLVRGMRTMHRSEIAQNVQERYKALIHDISPTCFADHYIKVKMEEKYFRTSAIKV